MHFSAELNTVKYTAMMFKPARILIAQEKTCIDVLVNALAGYDLITTSRLVEAERMVVEGGIDLFVVGVHFEDSRGLELVEFIRKDVAHAPIIVVRYKSSEIADLLRQTIEAVRRVKAINAYVEADSNFGDGRSFGQRVREAVEQSLLENKRAFG
ncbi:MAG: hypothetical protein C0473_02705 [Cyanobacteria bacterium DS3.002]|nr:hypothetical protein [Cyanobacteria bacterium DS3.002]MBA4049726.1 hypothetical protein [Cyanobacteria bacterium DS2.008]MBA4073387.1 hypothetical protein [Cyanobacteria bacterium PR.023]